MAIDGSIGEGGGQIVRSAITISALIKKPIKITNIRSNRKKPGLKNQHITTIKLLSKIFNVRIENVVSEADWIEFDPQSRSIEENFNLDEMTVNIESAGSIPLLLQSLIPSVAISQKNLSVRIIGGTDVKYSPTIDYIKYVLSEVYKRIGILFDLNIVKRGFYPLGGGIVDVKIYKSKELESIDFCTFKEIDPSIVSIVGNLPKHIADRQISGALSILEKNAVRANIYKSSIENSKSSGSSILIYSTSESGIYLGADALGERKIKAETVGYMAAKKFIDEYKSQACIDSHLADMLLIPLCFVNEKSKYKVSRISSHLKTNLDLIKMMTGMEYKIEKSFNNGYIITIKGIQIT